MQNRPQPCARRQFASLIGNRRTGWTGEGENLAAFEPCLQTPSREVGAREIERLTKLDEHVERHQKAKGIMPTLVVNQVLNGHKDTTLGKSVVGFSDEH